MPISSANGYSCLGTRSGTSWKFRSELEIESTSRGSTRRANGQICAGTEKGVGAVGRVGELIPERVEHVLGTSWGTREARGELVLRTSWGRRKAGGGRRR